jgi:hypothetical protein
MHSEKIDYAQLHVARQSEQSNKVTTLNSSVETQDQVTGTEKPEVQSGEAHEQSMTETIQQGDNSEPKY